MFDKIQAQNLFSWKDLEYDFRDGVSAIDGFNFDDNTPEGSGKSSIPNILCWTLFGKIPKDAKIDDVIKQGEKSGSGTVVLSTGHEIHRSRNPNRLKIKNPDGSETLGKDSKETQSLIETLIGMSFETFCQSVYFPQNYPQKFITANEADRARILSEIQDLSVYDKASAEAHNRLKQASLETNKLTHELSYLNKKAEDAVGIIDLLEEHEKSFADKKANKIKELQTKIKTIQTEIAKINVTPIDEKAFSEHYKQVSEQIKTLEIDEYQVKESLQALVSEEKEKALANSEIKFLKDRNHQFKSELEDLGDHKQDCPTCGSPFKEGSDHLVKIEDKKQKIVKSIQTNDSKIQQILKQLDQKPKVKNSKEDLNEILGQIKAEKDVLTKRKVEMEAEYKAYDKSQSVIKQLESSLTHTQAQLEEVSKEEYQVDSKRKEEMLKTLQTTDAAIQTITQQLEELKQLEAAMLVLKDEFKKLKSYMFSSLLTEISVKSTKIASELFEIPVKIVFFNESGSGDVSKINLNITLDNNIRPLGLLSGGQFRRVQIAVDLALSEVIAARSEKPCNIRILDEPFKDLSSESMYKMVELLERLEGKTVLIEHSPLIKPIIKSVYKVAYRDGTSTHAANLV